MNQIKNNRTYPAIFEQKGNSYGGIIPDIPGAFALGDSIEEVTVAAVNPVSLEIERAISASGLTRTEIAARMSTSASVISRMTNPFYFGHSISLLQRFAEAVHGQLEVRIVPPHTSADTHHDMSHL